MYSSSLFAVEKLDIDPETLNIMNGVGLILMGSMLLGLVGILAWHLVPALVVHIKNKRAEKIKAANSIWFDAKESVLHCGHSQTPIELKSFEYYVCIDTFASPSDYQDDIDIMEKVDRNKSDRAVEQAVNRLNTKAKTIFGLDEKLFKRGKDSTAVNEMYRSRIVQ